MAPLVRDADPAMRRLLDFVEDQDNDRPVHVMALALRAALSECAQEQSVAVAGLEDQPDPDAPQAERDAASRFRWDSLGRLYMANKVVRRITELVDRLGDRPAVPEPLDARSEIVDALADGFEERFRRAGDRLPASRATIWRAWLAGDEWEEIVGFVLEELETARFAVTKDPTVCEDYPAPCNCDDPLIHNGH